MTLFLEREQAQGSGSRDELRMNDAPDRPPPRVREAALGRIARREAALNNATRCGRLDQPWRTCSSSSRTTRVTSATKLGETVPAVSYSAVLRAFRAATMREACSRKPRGKPGYENRASCEPVLPRRRNPSVARTASATLTSADSAATRARSGSPSAFKRARSRLRPARRSLASESARSGRISRTSSP